MTTQFAAYMSEFSSVVEDTVSLVYCNQMTPRWGTLFHCAEQGYVKDRPGSGRGAQGLPATMDQQMTMSEMRTCERRVCCSERVAASWLSTSTFCSRAVPSPDLSCAFSAARCASRSSAASRAPCQPPPCHVSIRHLSMSALAGCQCQSS